MFQSRLTWFAILTALTGLLLVGRLIDIQLLRADEFEEWATRLLTRPKRFLPAPRGSILDRDGEALVSDVPVWDISIHYAVLAGRSEYLRAVARRLRERGDYPRNAPLADIETELRHQIAHMWQRLAALTGTNVSELIERAQGIERNVERVRDAVMRSSGTVQSVAEEFTMHPVLTGVNNDLALSIRMELEDYPWLRIVPSSRRQTHDADSLAHLLGRTAEASRDRIAADPLGDDPLRSLRSGDLCGISGVERLAEAVLRGTRGRIVEEIDRREIEHTDPVRGSDVTLSVDARLQRRIYDVLEAAVQKSEFPCGGAAVVIDVATREILALVSYPAYDVETFGQKYAELESDAHWLPLRFRAVSAEYPPGSTCKAITLVGALSEPVITPEARIHCRGYLLDNQPNMFRCWIYNQYQTTHDATQPAGQSAEDAIRNSCNIYFFKVGERLGPDRLCEWFSAFGLGRTQETGLIEEADGVVPSQEWLAKHRGRGFEKSDVWNYAIGQGEVTITPLQAANVAASIASGHWEPVRLVRHPDLAATRGDQHESIYFESRPMQVLRAGMWRVVNEPGGTAHAAMLSRRDVELCGKTGSAQASPRVLRWRYTLEWPDGRRETVVAASRDEAVAAFPVAPPKVVGWRAEERFPPVDEDEGLPSHAWFIGYTQPTGTARGASPRRGAYAISVIVEYGGSGGRVAGPVAKQIAELLFEEQAEDRQFGAAW